MATITFTASDFCTGNGHYTLTLTGAKSWSGPFQAQEIMNYNPSETEIRQTLLVLQAIWANGKTPVQAKTGLSSGVLVTIG